MDVRAGLIVPNQVVVIANSHILEVGHSSEIAIPHGIEPIDATGKFLIPGLWEMHAHTSSDQVSRDVVLPLFIANGITGIRSMQADCLKDSNRSCSSVSAPIDATNRWRQDIAGRQLIGPRIIAGSTMVNGPAEGESSTVLDPATAEHGRAHARLLQARGVDFIKIYDELSRDAYFAIADEARKLGLPFAGHVPVAVRATEASDAGQASIEHCRAGISRRMHFELLILRDAPASCRARSGYQAAIDNLLLPDATIGRRTLLPYPTLVSCTSGIPS